jgi:hypothetical protein
VAPEVENECTGTVTHAVRARLGEGESLTASAMTDRFSSMPPELGIECTGTGILAPEFPTPFLMQ